MMEYNVHDVERLIAELMSLRGQQQCTQDMQTITHTIEMIRSLHADSLAYRIIVTQIRGIQASGDVNVTGPLSLKT